jgi:ankyrin repeat protein
MPSVFLPKEVATALPAGWTEASVEAGIRADRGLTSNLGETWILRDGARTLLLTRDAMHDPFQAIVLADAPPPSIEKAGFDTTLVALRADGTPVRLALSPLTAMELERTLELPAPATPSAAAVVARNNPPHPREPDAEPPTPETVGWFKRLFGWLFASPASSARPASPGAAPPARRPVPKPHSIFEAAHDGDFGRVQLLLDQGANPNATDPGGRTAVHWAAISDFFTLRVLLERGGFPGATDVDGATPLHLAAEYGMAESARLLLEHRASHSAKTLDEQTPVEIAEREGYPDIVGLLEEFGAQPPAPAAEEQFEPEDGFTDPCSGEPCDLPQNASPTDGSVHEAAAYGSMAELRHYLNTGGDPNARDHHGRTLLCWAARGEYSAVRLLIDSGADLNAQDRWGLSPLHHAAYFEATENIRQLLRAGARTDLRDTLGRTPVEYAEQEDEPLSALVLRERGLP